MSNSSTVEVQQIEDDREVSIRANLVDRNIFRMHFNFEFQFIDRSKSQSMQLIALDYYYSDEYGKSYLKNGKGWTSLVSIYQEKDGVLNRLSGNRIKQMKKKKME